MMNHLPVKFLEESVDFALWFRVSDGFSSLPVIDVICQFILVVEDRNLFILVWKYWPF